MHIPITSSASQAASIAAQAAAKDGSSEGRFNARTQFSKQPVIEGSSATSGDRDAQGQGDGLPDNAKRHVVDELEIGSDQKTESQPARRFPNQSTGQLDIVG